MTIEIKHVVYYNTGVAYFGGTEQDIKEAHELAAKHNVKVLEWDTGDYCDCE